MLSDLKLIFSEADAPQDFSEVSHISFVTSPQDETPIIAEIEECDKRARAIILKQNGPELKSNDAESGRFLFIGFAVDAVEKPLLQSVIFSSTVAPHSFD